MRECFVLSLCKIGGMLCEKYLVVYMLGWDLMGRTGIVFFRMRDSHKIGWSKMTCLVVQEIIVALLSTKKWDALTYVNWRRGSWVVSRKGG